MIAGLYRAEKPHRAQPRGEQPLAGRLELAELLLLLPEALHHAHPADRGVHHAGQRRSLLLRLPRRRVQPLARGHRHQPQQRPGRHRDQRQQRRQERHHAERDEEQQEVPGQHRQHAEQPLHHRDVGGGPRDQLPGRQLVLPRAVQPRQRAEDAVAQVVLHVQGQLAADIAAQPGPGEVQDRQHQRHGGPRGQRRGAADDDIVDDVALDQRHGGVGEHRQQRAAEGDQDAAAVDPADREQAAHPGAGGVVGLGDPAGSGRLGACVVRAARVVLVARVVRSARAARVLRAVRAARVVRVARVLDVVRPVITGVIAGPDPARVAALGVRHIHP